MDSQEAQDAHERLVRTVFNTSDCLLVPPRSRLPWADGDDAPRNPTDLLMILAPVEHAGRRHGLNEVFQQRVGKAFDNTVQRRLAMFVRESAAMSGLLLLLQDQPKTRCTRAS